MACLMQVPQLLRGLKARCEERIDAERVGSRR